MPRRTVADVSVFMENEGYGVVTPVFSPGGGEFDGYAPGAYTPPVVKYLSPTGSDAAAGTIGAPYKTFAPALAALQANEGGDVIYQAGLYDYAGSAPGIDESHGIDTLSTRRVRIFGPGVNGKLQSQMAHITNFTGNNWAGINHGCWVGNVAHVEIRGLWIDCAGVYSMGLRVQGDYHLYDTGGRFRRRGRMLPGIIVDDCLVENSRQTNMNFRGNLWAAQVSNNISRAPGQDGGFVGEGIYFGTEPRSYGDDEAMSVARSYARFIAEGGSTTGTTVLYEIDQSQICAVTGNTIDLAYSGGISKSECIEVKPMSGTGFLEFDSNAFTSQVWAPGAGPLITDLTLVSGFAKFIMVTNNAMINPGRAAILLKGNAYVGANTIGAPSAEQQAAIAVGRSAYAGPETGGFTLVTGNVATVEANSINAAHPTACAFNGEFATTGQQITVCGNGGPAAPWKIWPTGGAITTDSAANRLLPLAEFGDPRATCV